MSASKYRALLARSVTSVSNKLSVAAVVGLALVPLAPLVGRSGPTPLTTAALQKPAETVVQKPAETVVQKRAEPVRAKPDPSPEPEVRIAAEPGAALAAVGQVNVGNPDDALVQLAAARRRAKQTKREPEVEPKRTTSAIATEAPERKVSGIATEGAGKVPIPSTEGKTEEAEAPKPDVWSDAEVITALKECVRLLGPIAAEVEVAPPLKHEECGTPAPVQLRRIGSGNTRIEINPPATVNCAMVAGLYSWVEKVLQPAALDTFGSPIVRLRSASGYSCRNRNGSAHNADKLSEHAKANAMDIAGFVTADGRTIDVARHWGPNMRDIREAERQAAIRAKEAKEGKDAKPEAAKPEPVKAEPTRATSAIATKDGRQAEKQPEKESRKVADAKAIPIPSVAAESDAARNTTEALFLRRLHKGACGTFGTVLGPEANEAHRDHFHFDLAPRKRSAFCE